MRTYADVWTYNLYAAPDGIYFGKLLQAREPSGPTTLRAALQKVACGIALRGAFIKRRERH